MKPRFVDDGAQFAERKHHRVFAFPDRVDGEGREARENGEPNQNAGKFFHFLLPLSTAVADEFARARVGGGRPRRGRRFRRGGRGF